jgi:nitrate/TMAO reductase-like tetraheme cytochrome c subunit
MTPCRDCEKRSVSCHTTCKEYGEYRKAIDDFNAKKIRAKNAECVVSDYQQKVRKKTKRRQNK